MRKVGFLAIVILSIGVWSCKEGVAPSSTKNYMTGEFQNITGNERILLQKLSSRNIETIDTIIPDMDGKWELAPEISELGFYRVFVSNNNFFNFITQPAETLKVTAEISDLEGTYVVTGSEETAKLSEFNGLMNAYVEQMDSLRMEIQNAQARQDIARGQAAYDYQMKLNQQTGEKARKFVKDNSSMLACLSALQQFSPEQDLELYEQVLTDLKAKAGNNDLYQDLENRVNMAKRLMPGAVLPDLVSNDMNGNPTKLSESLGAKYTLVDFWASWCKPCRMENPVIVEAYKRYNSKGFEIVGVSLDKDANQWKAAVQTDNLNWLQLSDLKFWESPSARQYNIESIPANFLLDSEMKIVAKNLRGAELNSKLEELIGG